jgi:hypothetical protein
VLEHATFERIKQPGPWSGERNKAGLPSQFRKPGPLSRSSSEPRLSHRSDLDIPQSTPRRFCLATESGSMSPPLLRIAQATYAQVEKAAVDGVLERAAHDGIAKIGIDGSKRQGMSRMEVREQTVGGQKHAR